MWRGRGRSLNNFSNIVYPLLSNCGNVQAFLTTDLQILNQQIHDRHPSYTQAKTPLRPSLDLAILKIERKGHRLRKASRKCRAIVGSGRRQNLKLLQKDMTSHHQSEPRVQNHGGPRKGHTYCFFEKARQYRMNKRAEIADVLFEGTTRLGSCDLCMVGVDSEFSP